MTARDGRVAWVVVVPVKDARAGKTRLARALPPEDRVELVRAMALDTIGAALAADGVRDVLVVTADEALRAAVPALGAHVVDEPAPGDVPPLDAAVLAGEERARKAWPEVGVAALLGDLPALAPTDLADALRAATRHARAFVADAQGTGTTLLTARADARLAPRFGTGSAAAHRAAGHVELDVPAGSTLRHDVDTPADLPPRAAGPHTAALVGGWAGVRA